VQRELPAQGTRTLVNFLLFVHLFSLAVVLMLNRNVSYLRQRLRTVPCAYLHVLYQDVQFGAGMPAVVFTGTAEQAIDRAVYQVRATDRDVRHARRACFHILHGPAYRSLDLDCYAELQAVRDGTEVRLALPEASTWPAIRYQRYRQLAWEIGRLSYVEEDRVVLGAWCDAVAARLLREAGVDEGRFALRQLLVETTPQAADPLQQLPDDRRHAPTWFRTWLQANARAGVGTVLIPLANRAPPSGGSGGVETAAPPPQRRP
jgi:hypothetical protein